MNYPRNREPWTQAEEDLLLRIYEEIDRNPKFVFWADRWRKHPMYHAAKRLGRSPTSVADRRRSIPKSLRPPCFGTESGGPPANGSSEPVATKVYFEGTRLIVETDDGRKIGVPVEWFPRLARATRAQRSNHRLIAGGAGIHWEGIDEDLSVRGLLYPDLPEQEHW